MDSSEDGKLRYACFGRSILYLLRVCGSDSIMGKAGSAGTTIYAITMSNLDDNLARTHSHTFALKTTILLPLREGRGITQHELTHKLHCQLNHEIRALEMLQQEPTIVQLHDVLAQNTPFMQQFYGDFLKRQQRQGKNYSLVLQYCPLGTLQSHIQQCTQLPEPEVLKVAFQLTEALAAMSSTGIIHRDIRAQNIMMVETGIKIIDFDVCWIRQYSTKQDLQFPYSEASTAPEVKQLLGMLPANKNTLENDDIYQKMKHADLYSTGFVLFHMMTRTEYRGSLEQLTNTNYSPELKQIVRLLLKEQPQLRISLKDLASKLQQKIRTKRLSCCSHQKRGSVMRQRFPQIEPQTLQTVSQSKQDSISISDWSLQSASSKMIAQHKISCESVETASSPKRGTIDW